MYPESFGDSHLENIPYHGDMFDHFRSKSKGKLIFKAQLSFKECLLQYESSTTEAGRSGELIYLVKMEVEDPGCKSPRSLEMLCRDHELQDLLAKLTDALKSIQKLTVQSMPSWAKLFKK